MCKGKTFFVSTILCLNFTRKSYKNETPYLLFIFSLMGSFTCQLRANEPVVTITTNVGVMKAKLYDNVPNHVKTFIERAKKASTTVRFLPVLLKTS